MSKNEIVTIEGFTGEVKQGKFGEFITVGVADRKKNEQTGEWETAGKTYYSVSLEPGHGVKEKSLYKVTGQLRLSAYKDAQGEARVSAWITKAQFEIVARGSSPRSFENPADILTDMGATPF